jgi:hypothetical protein
MRSVAAAVEPWLARLVALGVAGQFALAGAGAFGSIDFHAHVVLGKSLIGAAAVLALVAVVARVRPRHATVILVLAALQYVLGSLALHHPWVGALHGLGAVGTMAAAGSLAGSFGARRRRGPAAAPAA